MLPPPPVVAPVTKPNTPAKPNMVVPAKPATPAKPSTPAKPTTPTKISVSFSVFQTMVKPPVKKSIDFSKPEHPPREMRKKTYLMGMGMPVSKVQAPIQHMMNDIVKSSM